MNIDVKIRDEKLQYNISRAATKRLALSSNQIYKYEYVRGEEILFPQQHRIIQETKLTYYPGGKAFEKQTKNIVEQGKKNLKLCSPCILLVRQNYSNLMIYSHKTNCMTQ